MSPWDDLVGGGKAARDVGLAAHTTYKLGGPADLFVEVAGPDVLTLVAEALAADPRPVLVLGRGSNLLVADGGFRGVVLRLAAATADVHLDEDGLLTAGAALTLPRLARVAADSGRGGLEWGVGVPGTVGGAVRQNAGCFGSEIADVLVDADIVSLAEGIHTRTTASELDLGYRHSNLAPTDVVVSARFTTAAVDPAQAAAEMRRITRWRRDNQPGGTLNAGSVFKNPPDEAAGAIIDRLGLKGFAIGRVRVSPRHANFIEAEAGASSTDVRRLIDAVRTAVADRAAIILEPEIQFVGFDNGGS